MLNKKPIAILLLCFSFLKAYTQYEPNIDIRIFAGPSILIEEETPSASNPSYSERHRSLNYCKGISIYPNLIKDNRFNLGFSYTNENYSNWKVKSTPEISISPIEKVTSIHSYSFEFNFSPNFTSRVEPCLLIGVSYFYLQAKHTERIISYTNEQFSIIENILWKEPGYDIGLGSMGFNLGAGVNIKISERVYFRSVLKYAVYYQNKSEYLSNTLHSYFLQAGIGITLLKTKYLYK